MHVQKLTIQLALAASTLWTAFKTIIAYSPCDGNCSPKWGTRQPSFIMDYVNVLCPCLMAVRFPHRWTHNDNCWLFAFRSLLRCALSVRECQPAHVASVACSACGGGLRSTYTTQIHRAEYVVGRQYPHARHMRHTIHAIPIFCFGFAVLRFDKHWWLDKSDHHYHAKTTLHILYNIYIWVLNNIWRTSRIWILCVREHMVYIYT